MSSDDDKPRIPAPKTRSLRAPAPVAGVDPPEHANDDEQDAREAPRADRMLVLNKADGVRPAIRSVPSGRDASGSMQFDRRGSVNLVPGLNWVEAEAWEDAKYEDDKGNPQTAPGLRANLGLRIRAGEIEVVQFSDTAALIAAIKLTATRQVLLDLIELEQGPGGKHRRGVLDALDTALKGPERRALG